MVLKKIVTTVHFVIFTHFCFIRSESANSVKNLSDLNFSNEYPFNATLNWNVNADFCSINYFFITCYLFSAKARNFSNKTYNINSTTAYESFCNKLNLNRTENFDCIKSINSKSEVICNLNISNMLANSKYSFTIGAIDESNVNVWQPEFSPDYFTGVKLPNISLTIMSSLKNYLGIKLTLAPIDQTNGKIGMIYLFLVNNCYYNSSNFTIPSDLNELVKNVERCSNSTSCLSTCLIQIYKNNSIDFTSDIDITIAETINDTNTIEKSSPSLIRNPIIRSGVYYSTFFVFEIKNQFNISQYELISTSISLPIQVKASISNENSSNSNENSIRDWQIILVCCIVIVISIIIITIVILFVCRKRIKNICMRYNEKYKPNIELIYKDDSSNNSSVNKYEFNSSDIKKLCSAKRANDNFIFEQEFKLLPDYNNVKSSNAANDIKNAIKNRYTDVKAYDDSRVVLNNEEDEKSDKLSDYINANFVQGYYNDKKFIATQGPKTETLGDFWKMIYQNNVKIVVMLTDLIENNIPKCQRYWPSNLNSTETYGDYDVTFIDERVYVDYVKRTLKLTHTNKKNHEEESRIVIQYFYPSWADKLTPNTDLISIFYLIKEVNWNYNNYKESPIVVHCSAGIGRTGTYITLDAMKEKIEAESKIDIFGFISEIREKRQTLVQNLFQYIFIHDALCEYVLYKFTDIKACDIKETIKLNLKPLDKNIKALLKGNNRKKEKSLAEIEYDKISNRYKSYELTETDTKYYYSTSNNVPSTLSIYYLLPDYKQKLYDAYNPENKPKNRNQNAVCYDFNRVKLACDEVSNRKNSKASQRQSSAPHKYINATKLKYLKNLEKDFIITQDPLRNTIVDFYSMIIECDSNIIVSLNSDLEPSCTYWPNQIGQKTTYETAESRFSVEILTKQDINEKTRPLLIEQKFKLTETKIETSKVRETVVKHFIYNQQWPESKIPTCSKGLRDLAVKVQNLSSFSSKPVIVHAHGGASNCSLFVCLCILFNQLFIYEHIDICRLVRIVKPQKQNLFPSYDQYKFLYEAIYDYVNENGTNFKPMSKFDSFSYKSITSNRNSLIEQSTDLHEKN